MIRSLSLSRATGRNPASPLVRAECPRMPAPLASGDNPFRVFWSEGGAIRFRDETGRVRPVHIIRLRCVRHTLWRMARDARGVERIRLCTIYAEATETLRDVMAFRMGVVR